MTKIDISPTIYFSQLDEDNLFRWAQEIPCVSSIDQGYLHINTWDATGNDDAVVAPVVEELSKKSVEEIHAFREILARKLYLLDTKEHAKEIGEGSFTDEGYFSVDQFLYARCVVVANGKDFYEVVLKSPTSFPKDMEFEALLYIVHAAYENKTGIQYDGVTKLSYETFSNENGWR